MQKLDALFALLVADDPRRSADRILGQLVASHHARGGAVLCPDGERALVFVSHGLALEGFAALADAWNRHRATLEQGRAVATPEHVLAAVTDSGQMVAVVYLDRPTALPFEDFGVVSPALAQAVRAGGRPAPAEESTAAPALSGAEAQKQQMFLLLEKNEWNIARVARLLGVTRRTVYLRLRNYGIRRKRVPKTLKRAPAGDAGER